MTTVINALIIEDEAPARRLIRTFLEAYPQIRVLDECTDGFEGVKKITELKPDLVFLDVKMPRISGFEMLELLTGEYMPVVIFTTAYDEFALKSFEYNTCDYLLKPINRDRFDKAVQKALLQHLYKKNTISDIPDMISRGIAADGYLERIVIRSGTSIHVVQCEDIIAIQASDDYVVIHSRQDEFVKKQTLKFYEENLDPDKFIRVHRSFIIKIEAITRIEPYSKDAWVAMMDNGLKVSVSKAGYTRLKDLMSF